MEQRRARGMLAAAAVIFGTLAPFVRGISVSSGELALYRAVMAALLVGGYLLVSGQKLALRANRREAALLLLSGMAMGVNWILLFEAYRYTTVSVATLSYYFAPVLVTAACPLLFHERLTGKQIVCFVMSTLGLVLVIGVGGLRGVADVRGVLFGLGAAAFYAAVILLNKFIRSVAGIQRTFLQFLAAIVILIPYVAATGGVSLGTLDARGWVCLLIVGFFHTGRDLLPVFFRPARAAGAGGRSAELHGPARGGHRLGDGARRAGHGAAARRRCADPRLHALERAAGEKIRKREAAFTEPLPFFSS